MRRDVTDNTFFAARLTHESDAALSQIAHSAVQHPAGTAARAGRKIGLLNERRSQAAHCGVARDARADDPTADHEHVERRLSEPA